MLGGAGILVVTKNLDIVDTLIVEKHCGHLSADFMTAKIGRAAPETPANRVAGAVMPDRCRWRDRRRDSSPTPRFSLLPIAVW
jgi:hypothetical protein